MAEEAEISQISDEAERAAIAAAAAADSADEAGEAGRALTQEEIDNLLGFDGGRVEQEQVKTGIEAMLDKALLSYERLPMLEVVFDRFVRMLSTSLRNFTADNVDVDIHSITSLRFGDYVNSIPMPALLSIFKAVEWENFGIITFNGSLVYSMVDVLFGGRKSNRPIRIEGRPYTSIEQGVIRYISDLVLADMGAAFDPLSPATFRFERMEVNPRFATISHPSDAVILLQLRVDMEERGGNIEIMFPYVTLEPIKELLTQVFMGEKFGKDTAWEMHLGREIYGTSVEVEALLGRRRALLKDVMHLKVGNTLLLDQKPEDPVIVRCRGVEVLSGKIGRVEDSMAISVQEILNKRLKEAL
jgi:flagellar motor switch protein FliM